MNHGMYLLYLVYGYLHGPKLEPTPIWSRLLFGPDVILKRCSRASLATVDSRAAILQI